MMEPARYLALYLGPVISPPPAADALPPPLDLRHWYLGEGEVETPPLSLPQLFSAGVECGHTEARLELKRRVAVVNAQLDEYRTVRDKAQDDREQLAADLVLSQRAVVTMQMQAGEMQAHAGHLEMEVANARARIRELENSRVWRLSEPLRTTGHRVKLLRARTHAAWIGARRLPQQAALAASIARTEGLGALARRVTTRLARRRRFVPSQPAAYALEPAVHPLAFTPAEQPRVSIIVPVYGQSLVTFTCLKSLHAHTSGAFEVIVMDDASPEPVQVELREVTGVRFERNATNLGFIGNCNRGAELARGEILVFLNNDTIVTRGWLDALVEPLDRTPAAGLVGARLVYPDGRLQEAGGLVWRDGSAWNYGRDDDPNRPEYNYVREVDYCSGACLAIARELFASLGGFDRRYAPAYYEDTDLAFAVRAAGRKVLYQPRATIVHFEGRTSGTDPTTGVKRHQVLNREAFAAKWAAELASHAANGVRPELERDRWAQLRVLVVDACMLTPDQDSGSMRMQSMLEILTALKCKVTFVADNLEYREPYASDLAQRGIEVLFAPYVRSIADLLSRRGREFDMVVLSRHYVAAKHVDAVRAFAPDALVVFDTVDLHFLRAERLAELDGGATARAAARAKRDEELALIRKSDVTLVVSPLEQALLASLAPQAHVLVLSNIHDLLPDGKPFAERAGLVFIGSFQHPPNADAVLWYAREILPRLREHLPGVPTYIVGSSVPASIKALAADDFVVTGYVKDVTPYFTGCRVSVSPLRYGAGVKGKVNLAMSYGLPVVATSPSIEGMYLVPGEDVLVADEPQAFADAVAQVYQDEALWQRLAAGGRDNIRTHFSRDVARSAVTRLIARVHARRNAKPKAA
ncbi:MAG TPA: glycosyltransferase [Casimicrobiaceae bacterium]|nr:glycosyltransferase [Casimicrobiaceae bacterium]